LRDNVCFKVKGKKLGNEARTEGAGDVRAIHAIKKKEEKQKRKWRYMKHSTWEQKQVEGDRERLGNRENQYRRVPATQYQGVGKLDQDGAQ